MILTLFVRSAGFSLQRVFYTAAQLGQIEIQLELQLRIRILLS